MLGFLVFGTFGVTLAAELYVLYRMDLKKDNIKNRSCKCCNCKCKQNEEINDLDKE